MALLVGASAAAACGLGLIDCTRETSYPTVEFNQCEEIDKELKGEYGDDYRTNRQKYPITGLALQYIKSIGCESTFGYETLADEFCESLENYNTQIGGGETCGTTRDQTNTLRSRWCLNEEGPDVSTSNGITIGPDAQNRMKANDKCSEENLSNKYDSTWVKYCKAKPDDLDCTCYNMKNMVCDEHPNAAGCTYYDILESNKNAFTTLEERNELRAAALAAGKGEDEIEDPASYTTLKTKGHCRPRSCDSGYIPPNVKSDCASTYPICGQDIDIRTHTNTQLAVKCNYDPDRVTTFPDWWTEERDTSFMDAALARQPPFDTFPLNILPITRFPKKFNWKDQDVRYLTYLSTSLSSCICTIIIVVMLSLKK
jgi:hypothetical protein